MRSGFDGGEKEREGQVKSVLLWEGRQKLGEHGCRAAKLISTVTVGKSKTGVSRTRNWHWSAATPRQGLERQDIDF
jgi:hypothetical protein